MRLGGDGSRRTDDVNTIDGVGLQRGDCDYMSGPHEVVSRVFVGLGWDGTLACI